MARGSKVALRRSFSRSTVPLNRCIGWHYGRWIPLGDVLEGLGAVFELAVGTVGVNVTGEEAETFRHQHEMRMRCYPSPFVDQQIMRFSLIRKWM